MALPDPSSLDYAHYRTGVLVRKDAKASVNSPSLDIGHYGTGAHVGFNGAVTFTASGGFTESGQALLAGGLVANPVTSTAGFTHTGQALSGVGIAETSPTVPTYRGVIIPIFSVHPNEETPQRLIVKNNTIIRETLAVTEERMDMQPRPLYGIKYTAFTTSAKEQGYIRKVLELAKAMPVGMPVWMQKCKLTANVNVGGTALQFDDCTDTLMMEVLKEYALLWSRFDNWEVVKISALTATTITTVSPVTKNWVANERDVAYVIPLLFGKLERTKAIPVTDECDEREIIFEERFPVTTATLEPDPTPQTTYEDPDNVAQWSAHFSRVGVAGNYLSIETTWGGVIPDDYRIPAGAAFSIFGWMMLYDLNGAYIMSNWIGGNNEQFILGYREDLLNWYAGVRDINLGDYVGNDTLTPVLINTWYAIGLSVPAAGLLPQVYLDGRLNSLFYIGGGGSGAWDGIKSGGQNILIGSRSAPSYHFNGRIDQLGIWIGRALSLSEFNELRAGNGTRYTALTAAQKTNLRAYWEFDTNDSTISTEIVTPAYMYLNRIGDSSHIPAGLPPWHAKNWDSNSGGATVVPHVDRANPVPIV